jgi:hypothetical protein
MQQQHEKKYNTRRHFDWAVPLLILLLLLLAAGAFAGLGLVLTGRDKLTNGTVVARPVGAAFTTWFIPEQFTTIILNPGDRVPFMVELASQGITRTSDYQFVLPVTGVYSCSVQVYSNSAAYFFDLVLNPDTGDALILPGSEFNSNAQFNEAGLSPVTVLFEAVAGDRLAVVYNNSAADDPDEQMSIGLQQSAGNVVNDFHQLPNSQIHIRRIA